MSIRLSLAALALGAGCLAPTDDVEVSAIAQEVVGDDEWGCPKWACGSNSPVIEAAEFHDLHELGLENLEGFRIDWFRKGRDGYRADVVNGELYARPYNSWLPTLSGMNLIGMQWRVVNDRKQRAYRITVVSLGRAPFWATPNGTTEHTRTYELHWVEEGYYLQTGKGWVPICGAGDGVDDDPNMGRYDAVLFDDDRISSDSKSVTGQVRDWFNIGCAGHALAKQYFTGHTKASSARLGITTTLAQRTANLKMLVADYCGVGQPFTVAGESLGWRDQYGWYDSIGSFYPGIEARWTDQGAACLNTPRIDWNNTSDKFGDNLLERIKSYCGGTLPPPCTGGKLDMQGTHVVSAYKY